MSPDAHRPPTATAPAPRGTPGGWQGRPAGLPGAVPPPSVPLAFFGAAAVGLVACGVAWIWTRGAAAVDPTADPVVGAVHFGVLATLATGLLGATHQFTPVITGRPLRSPLLARLSFIGWVAAAWMLPLGVATNQLGVTVASGVLAGLAILAVAANLTKPLSVRGKGTPVLALRAAVLGAVATAFLGVAFVGNRQGDWFAFSGHVDVAMGVLGLFGWFGVTYLGVAEKLWPMFMLAHLSGRHRSGRFAVWGVASGAAICAPGLAWSLPSLAWAGALLIAVGVGAHLVSLAAHVRHRRRPADLHLAFVLTAAAWLPAGAGLAFAATLVLPRDYHAGVALAAASMAAFGGWVLEALVGHAHKVVPFILWSALRARGVTTASSGKPLMFADLYNHVWAAVTYASVTAGIGVLCAGLAASLPAATAVGGVLLATTGVIAAANLSIRSTLMLRRLVAPSVPPASARPTEGLPTS